MRRVRTRGPLLDMQISMDEAEIPNAARIPFRWSAVVFAGAVLEIARALHRIAAEMERRSS